MYGTHSTLLKKNIKSPLKYNSPLFHITSNIDKHPYTQQSIQQHTHTDAAAENSLRDPHHHPLHYRVLFSCDSNTTLLNKEQALCEGEKGAHHRFKAITLVFLTHTPPPMISHHHRRGKLRKNHKTRAMPG